MGVESGYTRTTSEVIFSMALSLRMPGSAWKGWAGPSLMPEAGKIIDRPTSHTLPAAPCQLCSCPGRKAWRAALGKAMLLLRAGPRWDQALESHCFLILLESRALYKAKAKSKQTQECC